MVSNLPINSFHKDVEAVNLQQKKDDTTITVTDNVTDSVIDDKNSVKSGLTTVIVTDKSKKGLCEFCSAEFDKKVSWKRFCCDDCRIKAWEQKNGKRLNVNKL